MFKAKLVIIIVTAVCLVTQSNSLSQENAISGSNEITIINAGKDQNPHTGIFKLHNSRQTQFENTTVICKNSDVTVCNYAAGNSYCT